MLANERHRYWDNIADHVNSTCDTEYTANQCRTKFAKLVNSYNVTRDEGSRGLRPQ